MPERLSGQEAVRGRLSELMDGELGADEARRVAGLWRSDADARRTWHAYHLIGDVLRSDDLATPPAHDEAFLQRVRARLADEPVVLAPPVAAVSAAPAGRRGWMAPAAVAAGFVVVAGVLVLARNQGAAEAPMIAAAPTSAASAVVPVSTLQPIGTADNAIVVDGRLIRDSGLDRYLAAHRRVGLGAAVEMPGSGVRAVEAMAVDAK